MGAWRSTWFGYWMLSDFLSSGCRHNLGIGRIEVFEACRTVVGQEH